jgi:RHS repeat-associated protein
VRRLAWSPASRLAGVTLEDGAGRLVRRLAYARDGQLERAVKVDSAGPRLTLYAGEHFEIEVDLTGGAVTTRAHALLGPRRVATRTRGRGEAARLAYLHRDHLQSVVAVTGAGGELAAAASLGVRGEVRGQAGEAGSDLLFTGHRAELSASDGFSLYDFRARLYDPDLGLFLSPDEAQDPHNAAFGWNRYLYVGNNPATAIDPTGRYSWWNPSTWDVWNNPVMDLVANKDTAAFAAGAGDAASMGLTDMAREATGLNQVVDKKSGAYAAGEVVGTVAGAALPTPPGMNAAMKMAGKAVELTGKAVVATGKTVAKGLKKVAEVGDVAFGALNHLREAKHLKTKLERARSAVEEGIWREPKAGGLINGTEVFPPGSDGALKKFSDHYVADDAVLHLETFGKQSGVTERVAEAAEKTLGLYD